MPTRVHKLSTLAKAAAKISSDDIDLDFASDGESDYEQPALPVLRDGPRKRLRASVAKAVLPTSKLTKTKNKLSNRVAKAQLTSTGKSHTAKATGKKTKKRRSAAAPRAAKPSHGRDTSRKLAEELARVASKVDPATDLMLARIQLSEEIARRLPRVSPAFNPSLAEKSFTVHHTVRHPKTFVSLFADHIADSAPARATAAGLFKKAAQADPDKFKGLKWTDLKEDEQQPFVVEADKMNTESETAHNDSVKSGESDLKAKLSPSELHAALVHLTHLAPKPWTILTVAGPRYVESVVSGTCTVRYSPVRHTLSIRVPFSTHTVDPETLKSRAAAAAAATAAKKKLQRSQEKAATAPVVSGAGASAGAGAGAGAGTTSDDDSEDDDDADVMVPTQETIVPATPEVPSTRRSRARILTTPKPRSPALPQAPRKASRPSVTPSRRSPRR